MSKRQAQEQFARQAQTKLKSLGFYKGEIDDWPGPATTSAFNQAMGIVDQHAPPIVIPHPTSPDDLPKPAPFYVLPRETTAELDAFYGTARKNPPSGYLDWFSFPHPQTRLYSRTGTLLKDRSGDERLDHTCHHLLVGRLTAALAEIYSTLGKDEFEKQGWHIYGGCHNYRQKTGGSGLSVHSWGIGPDMNPLENSYNSRTTTFSYKAIDIMEKWGFLSGGRAWGRDWMHFQAAKPNLSSGSYYSIHGLPNNIK